MDKYDYKKLTPFKWFVLENFPLIDEDFDALTNWQLFCKLGKEINKIINSQNNVGAQMETVTNAFITLQNYVDNYFDNLDVQDEINNKLDAMVEDGTLDQIINQEIFGGIQEDISDLQQDVSDLDGKIDTTKTELEEEIDSTKRNALYIGNSYLTGVGSTGNNNGIYNRTKSMFNNTYIKTSGGIGFLTYTEHSDTFNTMLNNAVSDTNIPKDEITDIIIVSAWGDTRALRESASWSTFRADLQTAVQTFMTTVKNNFPNIKRVSCTLGESRGQKHIDDSSLYDDAFWVHHSFNDILPKNEMEYLGWIGFNLFLNSTYFSSDHYHPNDTGYKMLASLFKTAYSGTLQYIALKKNWSSRPCNITSGSTLKGFIVLTPDEAELNIQQLTLAQGSTPSNNTTGTLLLDFGVNLPFSLPMPNGQTTELELTSGFCCTTMGASDASFDASTNYMARVSLTPSSDLDSTALSLHTFGNSKTISSTTVNSICWPCQFKWNLVRFG